MDWSSNSVEIKDWRLKTSYDRGQYFQKHDRGIKKGAAFHSNIVREGRRSNIYVPLSIQENPAHPAHSGNFYTSGGLKV